MTSTTGMTGGLCHRFNSAAARSPVSRFLASLAFALLPLAQASAFPLAADADAHPTAHSQTLRRTEAVLAAIRPDTLFVIFDDDRLDLARAGAPQKGRSLTGLGQLMLDQARDQTGLNLAAGFMAELAAEQEKHSARAMPGLLEADKGEIAPGGQNRLCLIVPGDPDEGTRAGIGRFSGADRIRGLDRGRLVPVIDAAGLKQFTLWHEGGHCLESWPIPAGKEGDPALLLRRHKGEVVADVFASLMLAREGRPEAPEVMADLRTLYVAWTGPALAHGAASDAGWGEHAGAVYYTAPALRAAQAWVNGLDGDALAALTPAQAWAEAVRLADAHALDAMGFAAMDSLLHQLGAENQKKLIRWLGGAEAAAHMPQTIGLLRGFITQWGEAAGRVLAGRPLDAPGRRVGKDAAADRLAAAAPADFVATLAAEKDRLRQALAGPAERTPGLAAQLDRLRQAARRGPPQPAPGV